MIKDITEGQLIICKDANDKGFVEFEDLKQYLKERDVDIIDTESKAVE